jgi:hypothetical protein
MAAQVETEMGPGRPASTVHDCGKHAPPSSHPPSPVHASAKRTHDPQMGSGVGPLSSW